MKKQCDYRDSFYFSVMRICMTHWFTSNVMPCGDRLCAFTPSVLSFSLLSFIEKKGTRNNNVLLTTDCLKD